MKNVLTSLNARLVRVEVVSLKDDVFYGNLVIDVDGKILEVDSRPSDALAMAVRAHVPIFASRDVMETAGILPEQDLQSHEVSNPTPRKPDWTKPGEEESSDRLSVYEDFLQNINLDSLNKPSDDEPNESPREPDEPGV
jgi:bifunctional DNase/RNase